MLDILADDLEPGIDKNLNIDEEPDDLFDGADPILHKEQAHQ